MKINHSTSNSFKGLYIIKGTGREVSEAMAKISKKNHNNVLKEVLKENTHSDLKGCYTEMLTGIFGKKQPLTQTLVATNDDVQIIDNYYSKLFGIDLNTNIEDLDEVHATIFRNRVDKFFKKNLENFVEYHQAQKKCTEHGDASSLSSFILKQAVQAKKKLIEILTPYGIKESSIKTLNATNVLEAIENETFDYVNGIITEKNTDLT